MLFYLGDMLGDVYVALLDSRNWHRNKRCIRSCGAQNPVDLSLQSFHAELRYLRSRGASPITVMREKAVRKEVGMRIGANEIVDFPLARIFNGSHDCPMNA